MEQIGAPRAGMRRASGPQTLAAQLVTATGGATMLPTEP
jgi:hypothetical protein